MLLDRGAAVDVRDPNGSTPAHGSRQDRKAHADTRSARERSGPERGDHEAAESLEFFRL